MCIEENKNFFSKVWNVAKSNIYNMYDAKPKILPPHLFVCSYLSGGCSFDSRYNDNKNIMMTLVKKDGHLLRYASERLKDDPDVVLEAMKQNKRCIKYANRRVRYEEKSIVLQIFKNRYFSPRSLYFSYIDPKLHDDKEVVFIK